MSLKKPLKVIIDILVFWQVCNVVDDSIYITFLSASEHFPPQATTDHLTVQYYGICDSRNEYDIGLWVVKTST